MHHKVSRVNGKKHNKCDLSAPLNAGWLSLFLTATGSLFCTSGPQTEKAWCVNPTFIVREQILGDFIRGGFSPVALSSRLLLYSSPYWFRSWFRRSLSASLLVALEADDYSISLRSMYVVTTLRDSIASIWVFRLISLFFCNLKHLQVQWTCVHMNTQTGFITEYQ